MTIYNKLNKTSLKHFMRTNYFDDPKAYNAAYEAVHTLAKLGFEDMKSLFDTAYEYDDKLFHETIEEGKRDELISSYI